MNAAAAIIGAGLVGRAWAMVFARAGWIVRLYDNAPAQLEAAHGLIAASLGEQQAAGLIDDAAGALARITTTDRLDATVADVDWVQEDLPEQVAVKREIFGQLDAMAPASAVLASSTSAISASQFTAELAGRARCLVAHPVNPPHLVPIVELCGAPWTGAATMARATEVMTSVGQVPILVKREIDGFILNRLQGALLTEAFRLVGEGYVSPEDLDKTIEHGLGLRWSFMGPFETIDLNAPGGIADYCDRYSGFYRRLAADPPAPSVWQGDNAAHVAAALGTPPTAAELAGAGAARCPPAGPRPPQARPIQPRTRNLMAKSRKVIITCAVTGAIHTPIDVAPPAGHAARRSPTPPSAPPRRARRSSTCTRATRTTAARRRTRRSSASSAAHRRRQRRRSINLTTGGAATMSIEERLQPALQLKPEVATLNMGSMNFGLYPMLRRFSEFQHDWERALPGEGRRADLQEHVRRHRADPDRLRGERHAVRDRVLRHRPPVHGARTSSSAASSSRRCSSSRCSASWAASARTPRTCCTCGARRTGCSATDYQWSVLGAGRNQMPVATISAAIGGHVRVGLEDSLWDGPGHLAETNAAQVRRIAAGHRGARTRGGDAGRGAADSRPEGQGPGRVLTGPQRLSRPYCRVGTDS